MEKEQEYILKYETFNPDKGYNGTFGGEAEILTKQAREKIAKTWACKSPEELKIHGSKAAAALKGRELPPETRRKMSESRSGSKNHNYGKKFSDEHRQKLSEAHKGKTQTDETKQKRSATLKGNVHNARKIVCINTGETFDSIQSAEERYKVSSQNIGKCCMGKLKTAGKHPETGERFSWKYIPKQEPIIDDTGGENT